MEQVKIYLDLVEPKYKAIRLEDGTTKSSSDIKWIEYDEQGRYKKDFKDIAIGRSLLMSPFNQSFTWLTTTVTEIISQTDDCIKFKTNNSTYELWKI